MVLGEVEETVTTVELDEETFEEIYKVMITGSFVSVIVSCFSQYIHLMLTPTLPSPVNKEEHSDAVCER